MKKVFLQPSIVHVVIAAFILSFLLFSNGIGGDFVFDDVVTVQKRDDIKKIENFFNLFISPYHQNTPQTSLYRPLVMASFMMKYTFFGNSPAGFHVINIIIHAINSVLVFWFALYVSKSHRFANLTFLLFLVLPIHTEAVTWISGRAELLAFFWSMASLYLFSQRKWKLTAVALLLALLSKEISIMVIPIMIYLGWARDKKDLQRILKELSRVALSVGIYCVLRFIALGRYFLSDTVTTFVENPIKFIPLYDRVATAFYVTWLYIERLFWPIHLSADYSYSAIEVVNSIFTSPRALFGFLTIFILVVAVFWKKTRTGILGISAVVFLAPFLLVSNLIFPIGTIMGERLMYFSSLGFVMFVAYALYIASEKGKITAYGAFVVFCMLITFWSFLTVQRNLDWQDNKTIFNASFRESPNSVITRSSRAALFIKEKKWENAREELSHIQQIYPEHAHSLNLMGIVAHHDGDFERAEELYKKSISLSINPVNQYINLSNLYLKLNRVDEAAEMLLNVIMRYPYAQYVASYAYLKISIGKPDVAISIIREYFGENISHSEIAAALGTAYFVKQDYRNALLYLMEAQSMGMDAKQIEEMIKIAEKQTAQ